MLDLEVAFYSRFKTVLSKNIKNADSSAVYEPIAPFWYYRQFKIIKMSV